MIPGGPRRRHGFELPLTPMIDLFSMILIFLVLGTTFGSSDMNIPQGLVLPKSRSQESPESAPQVSIWQGNAKPSFLEEPLSVKILLEPGHETEAEAYRKKISDYVASLPGEARGSGVLLNVIADRDTPYREVFAVSKFFREAGFESLLFAAQGEER
jgi:biopolymer transport protein ExbD